MDDIDIMELDRDDYQDDERTEELSGDISTLATVAWGDRWPDIDQEVSDCAPHFRYYSRFRLFVAIDRGQRIGFAYTREPAPQAQSLRRGLEAGHPFKVPGRLWRGLIWLAVAPDYQNRGIGRALMERAVTGEDTWALVDPIDRLVRFYTRAGWYQFDTFRHQLLMVRAKAKATAA